MNTNFLAPFFVISLTATIAFAQENTIALYKNDIQTVADTHQGEVIFHCEDKIIAAMEVPNPDINTPSTGDYVFEFKSPDQRNDQIIKVSAYHRNGVAKTPIYAWISLNRGTFTGIFSAIDPAIGYENVMGHWEVKLTDISKRKSKASKAAFSVLC